MSHTIEPFTLHTGTAGGRFASTMAAQLRFIRQACPLTFALLADLVDRVYRAERRARALARTTARQDVTLARAGRAGWSATRGPAG